MTFRLTIDLGAGVSVRPEHLASLIREVASRVEQGYPGGDLHDTDGNHLGSWDVSVPAGGPA